MLIIRRACMTNALPLPTYNTEGEKKALYCKEHKLDGMIDVHHKTCLINLCDTRASDKYEGYCFRCFIYTFPDSSITRNYKTKERYIANILKEWISTSFPDLNISFDKKISGGCSLRRPDIFIDLITHVLIIEIDETQHKQTTCENLRMTQLFEDVAQRPCVFIRFNPDSYIDSKGRRIQGCFKYTQKGLCVIDSKERLLSRLEPVMESLKTYLCVPQEKSIQVDQYWYDEITSEE